MVRIPEFSSLLVLMVATASCSSSGGGAANHLPVAAPDVATTAEDTAVVIDVLANDSDADKSDVLAIADPGVPAHGEAVILTGGKIRYMPAPHYTGSDSFSYTVTDGGPSTVSGVVSLTVTPAFALDRNKDGVRRYPWGSDFDDDGDGALQVEVGGTDFDDGDPSVQRNGGDGTFTPGNSYPVGSAPTSIVTADFNNDGKLDWATTNQNDYTLSVYLGIGDGTFAAAPAITLPGTNGGGSILVGDFNEDGNLDIIAATSFLYLGKGDGTFIPGAPIAIGNSVSIRVADINDDGHLDLVSATYFSGITVVFGTGHGTFGSPVNTPVAAITHLAIGDFNENGRLDVAATTNNSNFQIRLGATTGAFLGSIQVAASYNDAIAVGDVNGDGHLDLVTGNPISTEINVSLGNGEGGFSAPTVVPGGGSSVSSILVTDINGDGAADLVITTQAGGLQTALGNGNGTFGAFVFTDVGSNEFALACGDFNHDGKLDLVIANISSDNVAVLLGN